jgi:dipeptidyl aminopeptidase/acylaminoacyl peptidase
VERPGILAHDGALQWRGDSRTLCFRGEEKARVRICAYENVRDGGAGRCLVLTPGDVVVGAFDFDRSGEKLAAVVETVKHTGDICLVENLKCTPVTDVNPQVRRWKLPQITTIAWIGADGDAVEGILELPPGYKKGDGPLPLIVELHGGPTASTRLRLRLWIYGRALMAAKGYALLSPNYHGSTGYGDEFTAKLIGRENDIEVIDIRTGIRHLIDEGFADPDRIGVMGWSNGGFLTNSMITSEPDLFRAASSGAGVLDQALQWATEDTPGHVINYMQGLPWEKPEAYIKGSPLYSLHRVKTPTLIHVGGSDPRVPPAHSRALYRGLKHYLDVPVELVVYPGEGHGLSTYENRLAKMKWDLAWFDKYLLGKDAGSEGDEDRSE